MSVAVKCQWIDAVKGCAMLGIVAIHVAQSVSGMPSTSLFVLSFGSMGVQLFYMISAFTTCVTYHRNPEVRWWKFMLHRYGRLAPIYWLGIVLYGLWAYAAEIYGWPEICCSSTYTIINIVVNVALVNTFSITAQNSIVPGGWSISCIAVFCMVFPWLYRLMQKKKYDILSGILLCLFGLMCAMYFTSHVSDLFAYFSIINQLIVFVIGMFMFFHPTWMVKYAQKRCFTLLCSMVFGVLCLATVMKTVGASYLYKHIIVAFCFIPLISVFQKIEGCIPPFLLSFGQKSYTIFICHFIFAWGMCRYIDQQFNMVSPYLRFLVYYGLTLVCSYFFALMIERYYAAPISKIWQRWLIKKFLGD